MSPRAVARPRKATRAKKVSFELITPEDHHGERMYPMLRRLVEAYHEELRDARIALAWCTSWKADVDGRVTLGKCRKASDLDREIAEYDFIILLNQAFWVSSDVTFPQREALLDHELCHATVALDPKTLEPIVDERGRTVYRIRKHDVEEFRDIVLRHGVWKQDLEDFARQLVKHLPEKKQQVTAEANAMIQDCAECGGTTWLEINNRSVRCDCFSKAQAHIRRVESVGF